MAKQISHYVCQNCGAESPKWAGKCSQCQQWNSLVETIFSRKDQRSEIRDQRGEAIKPLKLSEIKAGTFTRIKSGMGEFDRVLGGGIVPGSLVLVAGEPGIGKSTLLTQLALSLTNSKGHTSHVKGHMSKVKSQRSQVLYICGEESPSQIKIRIDRILTGNFQFSNPNFQKDNLLFLPETNLENILTTISSQVINSKSLQTTDCSLIIIDSIQTLWSDSLTGIAGSVGQVRQCSQALQILAKKANFAIFLIGHITKEGMIAGPKVLEHLADTVLYLEGDQEHDFRVLRAYKNRFGPTDEVGIFNMGDKGMEEVKNPGQIFISQRSNARGQMSPGSAIACSMQGIRPMLVEIQALVVPSHLAVPRRVASGIGYQKLQVICAVLQKNLKLPLANSDVFVNVAGGLKINEPAVDLAISLAIASSFKNKPLAGKSVCVGEVGLLGEIRKVRFMEKRIKEAKKLGYKTIIGEKEVDLKQVLKYLA